MGKIERDFIGYSNNNPSFRWPNNSKIAVQFVLNYEEGAENCILNGDDASETFLSEIIGALPYQNARHMSMESIPQTTPMWQSGKTLFYPWPPSCGARARRLRFKTLCLLRKLTHWTQCLSC